MSDTIKTISRPLPVKLTPAEREARGVELARANQTLADWTEEGKAIAKARKEVQKGYEVDRDRLTKIVAEGEEDRGVDCDVVADWAAGEAIIVRKDTGKIVERRPLTDAEQQLELALRRGSELSARRDGIRKVAEAPLPDDGADDDDLPPEPDPAPKKKRGRSASATA